MAEAPKGAGRPRFEAPKENILHRIPRWCIEHPHAVIAVYAAILIMAFLAVDRVIPRRFAPYVESPMLGVVTMMPGLSAQEMELYVSKPVEEQLINVAGLRFSRSTSQEGFSIVILEFNYGHDMRRALVDVQALLNVVQAQLPETGANLKPSWVVPVDPLNIPILSLSLRGDEAQGWDMLRVREFADNVAINRLNAVPGVFSVVTFGGYRRQLQVVVDRDRLAAHGLSLMDVRAAIDRFNVSRPGGTLTDGPDEAIVRVDTLARDADDLRSYPVTRVTGPSGLPSPPGGGAGGGVRTGTLPSPRVVYLRDVAEVVDTHWERRSAYRFLKNEPGSPGEAIPSIQVSVVQDPGDSSARIVPEVMETVRELEREYPGLTFEVAYDNASFVDILFWNVWSGLLVAVLLTALVMLLFLGEWRTVAIALVSIPTSLALAALLLIPFGMTFNSGTLIGLLISIGRLVDDSIVGVHAADRHLRMGKSPKDASVDGIAEVRLPILASTFVILLALTPLLFAGGIVELMFVELVWPLLFALAASTVVSFTLTPLLCARFLRLPEERAAERRRLALRALYFFLDPAQRFLAWLERAYTRSLRWMLRNRFLNVVRMVALITLGFTCYFFVGSEMMPLADVGQANGFMEMAPGTSFAETERAVQRLEAIMLKHPELERASIEIGQESMFETFTPYYTGYQMPQVNGAAMMLTFSDKDDRRRSIWEVIDAIQAEARATIPGLRRIQIKEMGSDVMATAAAPIHVNIYGPDLAELDRLGREVEGVARRMPELYHPAATWTLGQPDYRIRVDHQRAQEVGLSSESIAQQAYHALRGGLAMEFYRHPDRRQNTILVRYGEEDRRGLADLENLYLTTADGRQVPLKSVATIDRHVAPTAIERDGLKRVVGITGYYRIGDLPSMDVVMNLVANAYGGNPELGIEPVNFPPGYGMEMRGDMTQMMDSFRRLLNGLWIAILLIYLVLVVQFRGFLQPLQMIGSIPVAVAGVFFILWLTTIAFSTVSILGLIVLIGMDITTSVLLIDMIMRYRDRGVPRDQAVLEACPQRLRPILMTAITTIVVLLPVAFWPGTGLDAYQPLAMVIVGGLLIGTITSLFDIPIMHTYADDFVRWLNKTFLGREWEWPATEVDEAETE